MVKERVKQQLSVIRRAISAANREGKSAAGIRKDQFLSQARKAANELVGLNFELCGLANQDARNRKAVGGMILESAQLSDYILRGELEKAASMIVSIEDTAETLVEEKELVFSERLSKIPAEIKEAVEADALELSRCYSSGCYRATVILCGRILEVCMHRKYFELAKKDILEDYPGIGLGKLIGKLSDAGFKMPPGLKEQVELVNMVRVSSVHKKKEAFSPTRLQAYAIAAFTIEAVNGLW